MRRLVFGQDAAVAHWTAQRIPHVAWRIPEVGFGQAFGPSAAIGVADEQDHLLAGVVFHNWDSHHRVIDISCASDGPRWFSREIARSVLRYAFAQIQCQRLTAVTPRKATSTRRFLEGLGFKREGSARRGFGDDNAIIYGLLAEDWAAHPINRPRAEREGLTDGQEIRALAAAGA